MILQYRSEISGLRTCKTHAQFLRKRVLKNVCQNTRLRAFARIWCACFLLLFTLITVLCVAFFYTTKEQDKRQFLQTALRNISAEKQTADSHGVVVQSLIIDKCPTFTQIFFYGLNVNENNPSHRFSVLLACGVAVWFTFAGLVRNKLRKKFTQLKFSCTALHFNVYNVSNVCLVSQCKSCQTFGFYRSFSFYQSSSRKLIYKLEKSEEKLSGSRDVFQTVGTKDCDWPACLSKVNNESQHNGFVWDPSSFCTKAQKFHL